MTAARLWSVDGLTATLHGHPDGLGYFTVLVDGEAEPSRVDMDDWTLAPCCGFCDQPAEVQERGGGQVFVLDLLCKVCARDQFDQPSDWVRPIPKRTVRELVREARELRDREYRRRAAVSPVLLRA